ncbi:MAG: TlpA family protein disulfide reductase [Prevotella sp.]|nr:TlpA family protein disulfide reductase [Prevotella sp.]
MKKVLLALAVVVLALTGCSKSNKLHVKMEIKKEIGDTIVVMAGADRDNQQKFTGKDGVFEFDVELKEPTTLILVEPQVFAGQQGAMYQIPGVPGEEVLLTDVGEGRYDVNGSKFYSQFHEADLAIEGASKDVNAFMQKLQEMQAAGVAQDSISKLYQEGMEPLLKKVDDAINDFIKAHPDWEASAAIIPQLNDLDKMKAAVELLSKKVRNGRVKAFFEEPIKQMEEYKKKEEESAKKQATGTEAPDFTLNDINGKPLALSSLRGKYVILDFWGSWCGWCIKGFPDMKKYYEKYKGKFEILGIDCNDTEEKWKAAVEENKLPWLHVYCPKDAKVTDDYGITGFPTKIVIDPEGKIYKSIVGEDPAFYTMLDELFK